MKGWKNVRADDHDRHVMAGMGMPSGRKSTISFSATKSGYRIKDRPINIPVGGRKFDLGNDVSVVAWHEKTRNAFRHIAVVYKNGYEVYRTKIPYQNRTWESYEYQSVLQKAINGASDNGVLSEGEQSEALEYSKNGLEKQEHERVNKEFGRIGAIAQMGEIFGSTLKEKNDWKARMLKAGLGNKGLQMPEDWDSLDEETKEARLNAVIEFTKKKKVL